MLTVTTGLYRFFNFFIIALHYWATTRIKSVINGLKLNSNRLRLNSCVIEFNSKKLSPLKADGLGQEVDRVGWNHGPISLQISDVLEAVRPIEKPEEENKSSDKSSNDVTSVNNVTEASLISFNANDDDATLLKSTHSINNAAVTFDLPPVPPRSFENHNVIKSQVPFFSSPPLHQLIAFRMKTSWFFF